MQDLGQSLQKILTNLPAILRADCDLESRRCPSKNNCNVVLRKVLGGWELEGCTKSNKLSLGWICEVMRYSKIKTTPQNLQYNLKIYQVHRNTKMNSWYDWKNKTRPVCRLVLWNDWGFAYAFPWATLWAQFNSKIWFESIFLEVG